MPDGALAATERQFRDLLTAASDRAVDLLFFQIPEIRRHPDVRAEMTARYQPADAIPQAGLSALIVTGAETGHGPLKDAPYWMSLARLIDMTVALKLPTFWSCLAAQAALEHLDGIKRRPLESKCSGYYPCSPTKSDPLLEGIGGTWTIPHSRYNEVPEKELLDRGYDILTRSPQTGPDVFVRRGPPLFVFCQGHPEYDRNSLLLEYKRDANAYLHGARATAPHAPVGALDIEMERHFEEIGRAVAAQRASDGAAACLSTDRLDSGPPEWRAFAVGLYRNWLRTVG
jgi:homoserine O-succinyltransferase